MSPPAEYDAGAAAWAATPTRVYARFAAAMLEHSPVPLAGAGVLDVGAGTAVGCAAALARGADHAVASDISIEMLRNRTGAAPAVAADAATLPFGDAQFDLVISSFSLGHLSDPAAALAEWRRVAPAAVVSAFAPGPPHPAKLAVDATMERHGFVSPAWYEQLKNEREPLVEDPDSLAALARSAGYGDVAITPLTVDTGLTTPGEIVDWRWGMAHLASFVADLPAAERAEARRAAEDAVGDVGRVLVDIQVLGASG